MGKKEYRLLKPDEKLNGHEVLIYYDVDVAIADAKRLDIEEIEIWEADEQKQVWKHKKNIEVDA